jgi:triphosphoribosyl-dephospho-CoA synthetase
MLTLTLNLPDRAVPGLTRAVHAFNAETRQDLTLEEFLVLHLKEMAVSQEIGAAAKEVEKEAQEYLQTNAIRRRDELIADLDKPLPVDPAAPPVIESPQ